MTDNRLMPRRHGLRSIRLVLALSLLGPAAGCGWAEWPADGGGEAARPTTSAPGGGASGSTTRSGGVEISALPPAGSSSASRPAAGTAEGERHRVQSGETVYSLARRFGVTPRDIIDANTLQPPFELQEGQRIIIPKAREHVVRRGETLANIAFEYRTNADAIATANGLVAPYSVREGQRLTIPSGNPWQSGAPAKPAPQMAAAPPQPAPTPVRPSAGAPAAAEETEPRRAAERPAEQEPKPFASTDRPNEAEPSAERERRTAAVSAPPPPPSSGKGFLWPVKGRVVSGFGPKERGQRNDGINIAAARGTPVVAAETGVVEYAGAELPGFGNLVLIRHADGWVTAYAHNEKVLVKRGDTVKRGQVIASVGSSGKVEEPQLHFQVRKDKAAVDPRQHLPSGG
jgi:murein DD-endopeptidase MepM/ murein hydrolase activator NlpD